MAKNTPKIATVAADYVQRLVDSSPKTIGQKVLESHGVGIGSPTMQTAPAGDLNAWLRDQGTADGNARATESSSGTVSSAAGKTSGQ